MKRSLCSLLLLAVSIGCQGRSCLEPIRTTHQPAPVEKALLMGLDDAEASALELLERVERFRCGRLRWRLGQAGAKAVVFSSRPRLPILHHHEAVLSFLERGSELRRLLYRDGRATRLPPLPLAKVERLVIKARDELEFGSLESGFTTLVSLLSRAHRLLLGDVPLKGVEHLVVLPDGLLRALPLGLLVDREAPLSFAIERRSFSYAPCISSLRPLGPVRSAAVITPDYGEAGGAARRARAEEARAVARAFWSHRYRGRQASKGRLLGALRRRELVHFTGHGLATLDERGANAELVFGAGDALSVAELGKRRIVAPLVTLASCTTAYAARFRDGKRLMARTNIVEVLLAAGARSVIAASWAVKEGESARQMKRFYQKLKVAGPAAALAATQRERIRKIHPPLPRFWSMYAVYGAWR